MESSWLPNLGKDIGVFSSSNKDYIYIKVKKSKESYSTTAKKSFNLQKLWKLLIKVQNKISSIVWPSIIVMIMFEDFVKN